MTAHLHTIISSFFALNGTMGKVFDSLVYLRRCQLLEKRVTYCDSNICRLTLGANQLIGDLMGLALTGAKW